MKMNMIGLIILIVFVIAVVSFLASFAFAVDFQEIALDFSQNHTYCMHDDCLGTGYTRYNCQDFTHDLVLILRENNFIAYPLCGWLNHFQHAWVGMEIEPEYYAWNVNGSMISCRKGFKTCSWNLLSPEENKKLYGEPDWYLIEEIGWQKSNLIQLEPQTGQLVIPQGELYKYAHRCLARGLY